MTTATPQPKVHIGLSDSDLAAVREVVAEIQQRIARFGKGFGKKGE